MGWPPKTGEQLPRAAEAWCTAVKLEWILSEDGHGLEWATVFRIGPADEERFWAAIAASAPGATILEVRDRAPFGVVCGVEVELTIGERSAPATVSWHYEDERSAPRLVTAYPSL